MDDREAARLYKLAADQGDAYGQNNLGLFYDNGRGGVPKDVQQAAQEIDVRVWLRLRRGSKSDRCPNG